MRSSREDSVNGKTGRGRHFRVPKPLVGHRLRLTFLAGAGRDQADVAIFCGHPNSISLLGRHLKTKYEYETSISTVSMHVCDIGGRCEGLLWAFDML